MSNGTALALRPTTALDPYTPTNMKEALDLATTYAKSKILGSAYGTPEQVMLVMATGAELGIAPTAALRGLYVVEGRVFMSSDLMVALCLRAPQCERFDLTEQTGESAAYTVQRKGGQPLTFRWTLEDAARAKLGEKDGSNWKKYPGTMCRHRAASVAARAVFPDVIMGLYDEGEREDIEPGRDVTPPDVRPLTPAATKPAPVIADAELVESDDDKAARVERLLASVASEGARTKLIADERLNEMPKGAARARLIVAMNEAKARIAAAATAAVMANEEPAAMREPGEEG